MRVGFLCRFKVPNGCDLLQAGGLPIAFGTSHVGLVHRANLQAGQVAYTTLFSFSFFTSSTSRMLLECLHLKFKSEARGVCLCKLKNV